MLLAYICNWLSIYLAIFLCLVIGFWPCFHGDHLVPSEVSCLKRQTTLRIFALIQWPPGNVQSRFRRPLNFSANITHVHCILGSSRKTLIEVESLAQTWNVMQIVKFLKFQVGIISLDSQDPQILECARSIEGHATGQFIRSCVSLSSDSVVLDNVEITNSKT